MSIIHIIDGLLSIGASIDGDNPDHIMWILNKSQKRAEQFNIGGLNYRLTQGRLQTFSSLSTSIKNNANVFLYRDK